MTRFPAADDEALTSILRRLDDIQPRAADQAKSLFARAEHHGLGGVLHDAWRAAGLPLDADLERAIASRVLAREIDHEAHLALLRRIDQAFGDEGIPVVALKGPLFGQRFYARPSARGATDVDLLVEERRLDQACAALERVGYRGGAPDEARRRREHHHITLEHPTAIPVELHFHAYTGFGERLPSEPLVARSVSAGAPFAAIRVLEPSDELVYLSVHAAAHRFGRLGWLYDIALLVARMNDDAIALAASRAHAWRYARPVALAGALVVELFGVDESKLRPLGKLGVIRRPFVRAVLSAPSRPLLRSATRFAYTTMLSDSLAASLRYARGSSLDHARRFLATFPS